MRFRIKKKKIEPEPEEVWKNPPAPKRLALQPNWLSGAELYKYQQEYYRVLAALRQQALLPPTSRIQAFKQLLKDEGLCEPRARIPSPILNLVTLKNAIKELFPKNKFFYFRQLPPEIRLKIWNYAFPRCRVAEVSKRFSDRLDSYSSDTRHLIPYGLEIKVLDPVPAVMGACYESREAFLKNYPAELRDVSDDSHGPLGFCSYHISPAFDLIHFPFAKEAFTHKELAKMLPQETLQQITTLSFDIAYTNLWRILPQLELGDFSDYPSLKRVNLVFDERCRRSRMPDWDNSRPSKKLIDFSAYITGRHKRNRNPTCMQYHDEVNEEWGIFMMLAFWSKWDWLIIATLKWWQQTFPGGPIVRFMLKIVPMDDTTVTEQERMINKMTCHGDGFRWEFHRQNRFPAPGRII